MSGKQAVLGGGAANGAVAGSAVQTLRVRKGAGAVARSAVAWWIRSVAQLGASVVSR